MLQAPDDFILEKNRTSVYMPCRRSCEYFLIEGGCMRLRFAPVHREATCFPGESQAELTQMKRRMYIFGLEFVFSKFKNRSQYCSSLEKNKKTGIRAQLYISCIKFESAWTAGLLLRQEFLDRLTVSSLLTVTPTYKSTFTKDLANHCKLCCQMRREWMQCALESRSKSQPSPCS